MKFLVLGAGRMGLGAAIDLAHSPDVEAITLADLEIERARAVAATIKSEKINYPRFSLFTIQCFVQEPPAESPTQRDRRRFIALAPER